MIILDTNVVSETMRRSPNPVVIAFFDRYSSGDLALTTLTMFELRFGIEILPHSAERNRLSSLVEGFSAGSLGPILALDSRSAACAATYRSMRQRRGRPVSVPDSLIAGIALHHEVGLATRNIRDFEDSGLRLIDPWRSVER